MTSTNHSSETVERAAARAQRIAAQRDTAIDLVDMLNILRELIQDEDRGQGAALMAQEAAERLTEALDPMTLQHVPDLDAHIRAQQGAATSLGDVMNLIWQSLPGDGAGTAHAAQRMAEGIAEALDITALGGLTEGTKTLAGKCARAKALVEQAQALVAEVLADPEYSTEGLPRGVVPSGVDGYLRDAIGMLTEEPPEWEQEGYMVPHESATKGARI